MYKNVYNTVYKNLQYLNLTVCWKIDLFNDGNEDRLRT